MKERYYFVYSKKEPNLREANHLSVEQEGKELSGVLEEGIEIKGLELLGTLLLLFDERDALDVSISKFSLILINRQLRTSSSLTVKIHKSS